MPRIEIDFGANFEKYMSDFKKAQAETVSGIRSIQNTMQNIVGFSLFGYGASQIASIGMEAVKSAAQLDVLRNSFQGTAKDIELFRKATAGTVTEANLIKLSNQATDLGLTFEEQAILMSFAEDQADKYGGSVEENFQKVLKASEGATKGLKDLGIQKAKYDEIVEKYLKEFGAKQLEQLGAETQKWIQLRALIEASGVTLDDVNGKMQDAADKIDAVSVKWQESQSFVGNILLGTWYMVATVAENAYGWMKKIIFDLPKNVLYTIGIDISDEALGLIEKAKYGGDKKGGASAGSMEELQQKILNDNAAKQRIKDEEAARKKKEAKEKAEKLAEENRKKRVKAYEDATKNKVEAFNYGVDEYYAGLATQDYLNNQQTMGLVQLAGGTNYVAKADRPKQLDQQFDVYGLNDAMEQLGDTSQRAFDMMASGLARVIMRGENLKEVFSNIGEMILTSGLQLLFSIGLKAAGIALGVPTYLMANGGVIGEPVYGMGLNSKKSYMFGEAGSELVIPANRFASGGGMAVQKIIIETSPLKGDMRELHAGIKAKQSLDDQYR